MTDDAKTFESVKAAEAELEAEHATLHGLLDELKATESGDRLGSLLGQLQLLLKEHFAREEYPGGFYDSLSTLATSFQEQVRHLVDDHLRILSAVRSLLERASNAETPKGELFEGAADLARWLAEHEAKEHRMAEEAAALMV